MAVSLAAFYSVTIAALRKRRSNDRPILVTLLGLAGFFTALAVPLVTEYETLTVCWALLALLFLWVGHVLRFNVLVSISSIVRGIVKAERAWRYAGLAFFLIVSAKVFLVDLADMETIYRVIAFMLVGALLIAGSFVYVKAGANFFSRESRAAERESVP